MLCIISAHIPLIKMSHGQAQINEADMYFLSTGHQGSHVAMEGEALLQGKEGESVNVDKYIKIKKKKKHKTPEDS